MKLFQPIQLNRKSLVLKRKYMFCQVISIFRNLLKVNYWISYLLRDITTSYLHKTYLLVKNNLRHVAKLYRNISNSVCELNSAVNSSCQIWAASLMTKTLVLWQKRHTNVFIMSNYYKNLSLMKSIDENNFSWLKLLALSLKYLDAAK